ncbi:ABC transporter permease [Paucisalibacillus sp. EB02]|uniref:ABC transporter permease n=1 Tax=Paucisalibacillus sp. EB02 TaxID=1347087 RepID=UPI0004B3CB23|nr:ABC transporter permease [Paucisalibacillus sp. EB02]
MKRDADDETVGININQVKLLVISDAKNVLRDPLMLLVLGAPLYLFIVVKYGIPFVDNQLEKYTYFQLMDHFYLITCFIVLIAPMMVGMLTGFLLLDEKDDGILNYMDITPMKRTGFIGYRITIPLIISFVISFVLVILFLMGDGLVNWGLLLLTLTVVSLLGPLITMYLASFCKNKVEGITYVKLISIFSIGPIVTYMFESWWTGFAYIIPMTWLVETAYMSMTGEYFGLIQNWAILYLGGVINITIFLYIFYQKMLRSL